MASQSATTFELGEEEDHYLLESYATNHRHLNELHRLSAFQQVTTKVPPSHDGRCSWFAYEDAIDDKCDITDFVTGLPEEEQAELTPEQAQDERQVLTWLMAHRNRVLADHNTAGLREVYLEIFCTTKTTVDNPFLAPSGHGGRKTFLVIEEGHLGGSEGYWVEDEDDGAEGFLEAEKDAFRTYDGENYSWFQQCFHSRFGGIYPHKATACLSHRTGVMPGPQFFAGPWPASR